MWDSKRNTEIKNRLLDSVGEGEGGMIWENSIETCILPYVNRSPVQLRCMRQGTQGRCAGTTLRDGMGREVGGGFRMGHTCTRVTDSCQCTAKSTAAAKSLQSCPTLCDPTDSSPAGSPTPGIFQARALEWAAISFSNTGKWKWKGSRSVASYSSRPHGPQPTRLLCPWDFLGKSTGVGCHRLGG